MNNVIANLVFSLFNGIFCISALNIMHKALREHDEELICRTLREYDRRRREIREAMSTMTEEEFDQWLNRRVK
jgi:hypothetical protein